MGFTISLKILRCTFSINTISERLNVYCYLCNFFLFGTDQSGTVLWWLKLLNQYSVGIRLNFCGVGWNFMKVP